MSANKCEYCEREGGHFEVHHIQKLANIKGTSTWHDASRCRTTGLQTIPAWIQGGSHRTTLACAPITGACCLTSSTPLGRGHSKAAGSGPPKTPASSAWQTPQKDAARHGHSCAQNCRPDSSAY